MSDLCSDAEMEALTQTMGAEASEPLPHLDQALAAYPNDPRLHFLRGSWLVGAGRLIEGYHSLRRAVELAPDFAIARFQLGLFQLTSGEAENALDTWGRLDQLPDGHYLRKFVEGLRCLIRDDFSQAAARLREGVALNQENPPLNRDMHMVIEQCIALAAGQETGEAASETSLILKQFSHRPH